MNPTVARLMLTLAVVSGVTSRAQSTVMVPAVSIGGNAQGVGPWSHAAVDARHQMIYAGSRLQYLDGPLQIHRLRWRTRDNSHAGTLANVTVKLGHAGRPWDAPSTVYANNRSGDEVVVHTGPVTLLASAQVPGGPGNVFVDIALATPFVFHPTMGDLLVELEWSGGGLGGATLVGRSEYESVNGVTAATHIWRSGNNALGYADNWTRNGAPLLLLDYGPAPGHAHPQPVGPGCVDRRATFYEAFVTDFDLGGTAAAPRAFRCVPNADGGYDVAEVGGAWFTPASAPLPNGTGTVPLGFTFPFPGGSTTSITPSVRGFVWLGATGLDGVPIHVGPLLAEPARIAVCWADLALQAGFPVPLVSGTVHVDRDPQTGAAVCSWLGLPLRGPLQPPFQQCTFQLVLEPGGAFELRYRDCPSNWTPRIVGFSQGRGARDPGQRDWTATLPFQTGGESLPLRLRAGERPVLGTTVPLLLEQVPQGVVFAGLLMSLTEVPGGVSLASVGMPGCWQQVGGAIAVLPAGASSPTSTVNWSLPALPAWSGLRVFAQGFAFAPGTTPAGVVSSNGLRLELGVR